MPWTFNINDLSQARHIHARVSRQPGWVIGVTVAAVVLVFVIPLALLALAALLVGTVVYFVASLMARVSGFFKRMLGSDTVREPTRADDGRENVRVIQR